MRRQARTTNKCASCHVPHQALASPLLRTEVATTTPGQAATCLTCHDGKIASAANVANGLKDSFALASGHALDAAGVGGGLTNTCASCHDAHASPSQEADASGVRDQRSTRSPRAGNVWCLRVTTATTPGTPRPTRHRPPRSATPQATRFWERGLAQAAYTGAGNAHRLIPETTRTVGPGQEVRRAEGDCLYCHAAHRGANTYDALKATFRPTTAATLASDQTQGTYASMCFTCHGGFTPSGFATAPVDIKQAVTSGRDRPLATAS